MSISRLKALWSEAPWTLRIYISVGVLLQLLRVALDRHPWSVIVLALFLLISYFMLKGVRWLWCVMVGISVAYFIGFLAVLGINAITQFIVLLLLVAPPTRRHFAPNRAAMDTAQTAGVPDVTTIGRLRRLMDSPWALKAFGAGLFLYEVGRLILYPQFDFDAKPGRAAVLIIVGVAVYGAFGYFMLRGSRIMWAIAIGVLTAVVVVTTGRGDWPEALVPLGLIALLLLPHSVAFVWRVRREAGA